MMITRLKRIEISLLCGLLAAAVLSVGVFAHQADGIKEQVLRLHVLANSNDEADQALKLKVRDRIVAQTGGLFDTTQNKEQAIDALQKQLPYIKMVAKDEIEKNGFSYDVQVEICNMYFNTREYDTVTMPAGDYDALRVTIGAGKGHNWWCVIFPPMCLPAASESEKLEDVLNEEQLGIVENKPKYEVKFKSLEIIEEVKHAVASWIS